MIKDKRITVVTKTTQTKFYGHYRRDLEKENWHSYETGLGDIYRFRKSEMVCVLEGAFDGIERETGE